MERPRIVSLLRAPVIALKALLVGVAVLLWLAIVPIVDLLRTAVARLTRSSSPRD